MTDLKINTDSAITAANNIKGFNNTIRTEFSNVQSALTQLDNAWDGSAAAMGIGKFNEMKNMYPEPRYNIVDNFTSFLLQQVGAGYTHTEEVNRSLADAFK